MSGAAASPTDADSRITPTQWQSDTSDAADKVRFEIYRTMTLAERAAQMDALIHTANQMAESGVRLRHPEATDREVTLRVAALRNGADLMVAAFGWDPDTEGW